MAKQKDENLVKNRDGLARFSIDMLVMLCALLGVAVYLNGYNALWRAAVSCVAAVICEAVGRKLFGCPGKTTDFSAVVTGLAIALMLPAACPLWLPALGSAFAIAVVKIPFGGARRAPFVPAAAGWCFLSVCFSDMVFSFPAVNVFASSPIYGTEGYISASSVSQMLKINQSLSLNIFGMSDLLTGKVPGAMGTTCLLAMVGIAVYMLLRRPDRLFVSSSFIGVCALMSLLFPRVLAGRGTSLVMELSAGSLLFVALLVLNDPVTSPDKPVRALVYGAITGLLCMLLSYYGKYGESACFSVLIMNAVWPAVEEYSAGVIKVLRTGAFIKALKRLKADAAKHKLEVAQKKRDESESKLKRIREQEEQRIEAAKPKIEYEEEVLTPPKQEPAPIPAAYRRVSEVFVNEVVRPVQRRQTSPQGGVIGQYLSMYNDESEAYDSMYKKPEPKKKSREATVKSVFEQEPVTPTVSFEAKEELIDDVDYTKYLETDGEGSNDG